MRKFVISSLITFLLIFLCVSGVSYYFYHQITNGYIDKKIENTVYISNLSTKDALESQIDYNINLLDVFFTENKENSLSELNENVKSVNLLDCDNIEFGKISNTELVLANKTYKVSDGFALSNFIYERISIIDFSKAFANNSDGIYVVFILDDNTVALVKGDEFFSLVLRTEREYEPDTFIINSNGYIYYKTCEDKGNYFYNDYLTSLSTNQEKETLINSINSGEAGVSSSYSVNKNRCYLTYDELKVAGQDEKIYFISIFYKEKMESFSNDLTTPLALMFIMLSLILIVGFVVIYIVCLKKNDDIESSKLSLYYCKPFIFRVNKNGEIVYKNDSLKRLDIDWEKYQSIYDFSLSTNSVMDDINRNKRFTISFVDREDKRIIFDIVSLKVGLSNYLIGDDITEKNNTLTKALMKINYDEETNLLTKEVLWQDLNKHLNVLRESLQKGIEIESSLVVFSFDFYEKYLNIFGSKLVSEIVLSFVRIIEGTLNEEMMLYRLEKDIFAIVFKKLETYNDSIVWINNLRTLLKKPVEVDNNTLSFKTHFGVFNIELKEYDNLTSEMILENASIAHQRAKGLNVNDYMVYNIGLGKLIKREQIMEEDLKLAIDNNELVVYVQPQCDTQTRKIVGFEALTRWNNPKYINDSPQHFIELAEKNNMIIAIGKIIIKQALEIAKKLEDLDITISINVSPAQLIQDGFVNQLLEMTENAKVNPNKIALEITETFLVENLKVMSDKLKVLKNHGYIIHLDDFGTGYSSMLYLKDLPIDAIKIDKEFIKYINTDKSSKVIVSKIISLATSLNMDIIAEGVEDEKQYQFLSKNGCKVIQGWLISKAVPYKEALELLKEYNGVEKKK